MAEFGDSDSFRAWLEGKSRDWALVLAARAALRALPAVFASIARDPERGARNTIFPTFRAANLAWTIAAYPDQTKALAPRAVHAAMHAADAGDALTGPIPSSDSLENAADYSAARAAAYAASSAASAIAAEVDADAIFQSATAANFAATVPSIAKDISAFWLSMQWDAMQLKRGVAPAMLARSPLWAVTKQTYFDQLLHELGLVLKDLGGNWSIWQMWIECRTEGHPSFKLPPKAAEGIDLRIVAPEDNWWRRDPAKINEDIYWWTRDARRELHGLNEIKNWDYFVSYALEDELMAREIAEILRSLGHSAFTQFDYVSVDDEFVRTMQRGLDRSGRVIALYSPSYTASDRCQAEWAAAYNLDPGGRQRRLLPLLIAPTQLDALARQVVFKSLIGLNKGQRREAIIAAIRTEIPPALPASIRPSWRNNVLELSEAPVSGDLNSEKTAALFQAIREELLDLAQRASDGAQIDGRVVAMLEDVASIIPDRDPDTILLFKLCRRELLVQDYAARVREEWPAVLAADYRAICLMLSKALDQYPDRRLFERNAASSEIEASGADEVRENILLFAAALRKDGAAFIDSRIPTAFTALADQGDSEAHGVPVIASDSTRTHIAYDQLESAGNTLKEIALKSLETERPRAGPVGPLTPELVAEGSEAYRAAFQENYVQASRNAGVLDAETAAKLANRSLQGGSAIGDIARVLKRKYPKIFGWLGNVLGEKG